jgi:hypothetical protein
MILRFEADVFAAVTDTVFWAVTARLHGVT